MLKKSFLFNAILIALVSAGLFYLFITSLDTLTNHGKQTTVPMLMGKKMNAAIKELKAMGFQIKIDSTYQSYTDPLEVLFQEPEAGMSVKCGRTIFLTVNRMSPPSIEMPDLVNMSFRNALLTMHSYNLEMGDTSYQPNIAAGAVLEQWVKGKQIAAGTLVPFGTRIDLVIGEGLSGEMDVPNLIGMNWGVAKSLIDSLSLYINPLWEGVITDSNSAVIYMQQPEAINELDFKNLINEGDMIDVSIQQEPSQELLNEHQPGSKKLIGEEAIDTGETPIENQLPTVTRRKEIPDSLRKRKRVPGMNVHLAPVIDSKNEKNKSKATNTKSKEVDVMGYDKTKTKVKTKLKPKPKPKQKAVDTPPPPAKKKDHNISDEFN